MEFQLKSWHMTNEEFTYLILKKKSTGRSIQIRVIANLGFLGCKNYFSEIANCYSVSHIITYPSKELCSKMALGEVGVSIPWWCHPLVLLAPGYWRLFLNLVLLFQNWKSKIHKVSSLLSKRWPFFCFLCSVEVDTFIKCMETSRILDFQFWNNNTKFRKSLQ